MTSSTLPTFTLYRTTDGTTCYTRLHPTHTLMSDSLYAIGPPDPETESRCMKGGSTSVTSCVLLPIIWHVQINLRDRFHWCVGFPWRCGSLPPNWSNRSDEGRSNNRVCAGGDNRLRLLRDNGRPTPPTPRRPTRSCHRLGWTGSGYRRVASTEVCQLTQRWSRRSG